jgi:hypothetical protein
MAKFNKFIIIFVLTFFCYNIFAQDASSEPSQWTQAPYRLFRTRNVWTFLQLDTINGRIWQVHYSMDDNGEIVVLDDQDRASGKDRIPGRFTLYPTSNIYNFILHDQIDGISWQVQWSFNRANRFVIPIGRR